MANITVKFVDLPGKTLFAFADGASLANYVANKIAATQDASPNQGRYSVVLDDQVPRYRVFEGETQPADWSLARPYILETGSVLTEIQKIPRAQNPVAPGGSVARHLVVGGQTTQTINEVIDGNTP